jgi:Pectate lyase superfamily protein/Periplasmic copper-binding protein (NosD)
MKAIGGEIVSQDLNDNFSYLDSQKVGKDYFTYLNVMDYGASGDGVADDTLPIQLALDEAKDNAHTVVLIPKGTYKQTDYFIVYENTTILCDGAYFLRSAEFGPMLVNGIPGTDSFSGYNGRGNIKIIGGTFDGNMGLYTSTFNHVSFAHAENIEFIDCTFLNNAGAHHIEINGIKNCKIRDCHFEGHTGQTFKEAIQIDLMKSSGQFPSFGTYDNTTCQDVIIERCTFDNVLRGVGGHSASIGSWSKNVTVRNCKFTNITDRAIRPMNTIGFYVLDNTFESCGTGVEIDCSVSQDVFNYRVIGNTFKDMRSADTDMGRAITFFGATGIGFPQDILIANNDIDGCDQNGIDGYWVGDSIITGNKVRNCNNNGIALYDTSADVTISNNQVRSNGGSGIWLFDGIKECVISNNRCYDNDDAGIGLSTNCVDNLIQGNYCIGNNQSNNGLSNINVAVDCNNNSFQSNVMRQGSNTNKPVYGLSLSSTCTANYLDGNDYLNGGSSGGLNDGGTSTVIGNNR